MTNGVLASLAVSDFLAGLVGIPLYLACNVTYTLSWCLSSATFWRFVSVFTVLHLTVLTLHLFATVVHALRYDSLPKQRASVCLVCACWVCAAFVSLIQLSWIIYPDDNYYEHKLRVHRIYSIVVMIIFLIVPLVTMFYCHIRIFALVHLYRAEKKAKLRKDRSLDDNKTCSSVASEWKVAVVFAGMLAVFLICWAPYTYGGRWNSGVITFVGRVFDVLLHKIHCLRHQPGAFRFRLTRFPLCPSRMFKVLSYLEEKRTGSWNNRYSRLKND